MGVNTRRFWRRFLIITTVVLTVLSGIFAFLVTNGEGVYAEECDPNIEVCEDSNNSSTTNGCDPSTEACEGNIGPNNTPDCDPNTEACDSSHTPNEPCDPNIEACESNTSGRYPESQPAVDSCEKAMGSISWLVCPVTEVLAGISDSLYGFVSQFLTVKPLINDDKSPIFIIWNTIRNFANVIFIIMFLLVIYSQLTGRLFDTYNIKKILPRLMIVAILMNLSYYICAAAVDLSNIIGSSLNGVFDSARIVAEESMSNSGSPAILYTWGDAIRMIGIGGGAAAAGFVALAVMSPSGLVFLAIAFLLGAVVAILAAFLVLAARQAIIIVLVAAAPVAFALYLLPNTEKLFSKWLKLMSQMLMLFPIFALLYGGSSLAGWAIMVSANSVADSLKVVTILLGLAVQAIPLIATPFLLKNTGTILDKINDFARRPFNPLLSRAKGWASEKQQIARQSMAAKGVAKGGIPITPTRLAGFLERNQAKRQEALRQSGSNLESQKSIYLVDGQMKTKEAYVMTKVNVGTQDKPIWQWQRLKTTVMGKQGERFNDSERLAYQASTAKLDLSEMMRAQGRLFAVGHDSAGEEFNLTDKLVADGFRNHTLARQVKNQRIKGETWQHENDLLASKWNNDRQDMEDAYYDMWEMVDHRKSGRRHEDWEKRSKIFAGNRGEKGIEMAVAIANRDKAKIDRESMELTKNILGKTVSSTKAMKEWLIGYKLNDSKDPIFDADGNTIAVDNWIERKDDKGNVKFRINIEDKAMATEVMSEYLTVGDPDLIDILSVAGQGGRLNHMKADLNNYITTLKLKENIGGLSSLLATNVKNSLINNPGELMVNMLFSASKTEKASNFLTTDPDGIEIWQKILGLTYNPGNPVDYHKYNITPANIANVSEPNGPKIYAVNPDGSGGASARKFNKVFFKNMFDIASSYHLDKASTITKEKIKPETEHQLRKTYDMMKEEFNRVLDDYSYNEKTGKLIDNKTGQIVDLENLFNGMSDANPYALRRKTGADGRPMKFMREL